MADTKISALTAQTGAAVAAGDLFPTVDVSDTTMAVTGTNKKITYAELLNALGTVYQPLDSDLTAIAALTTTSFGRSLLALADAAALRTAAALGTAATSNTGDFDAAGAAAAAQAASQPLDSDLTAIAALTTTAFGRGLLALADAAALRTSAGLDADLGTFSVPASTTISAYGATLVDDADASTARTTLGLGTAATAGAASDTTSGIVELATSAETITGTDTARAVTPAGVAAAALYKAAGGASVENIGAVEWNVNTVAASGATETLDTSVYGTHDITMDQSCTFTFSNPAPSGKETEFKLILRGAFTPTFPAAVDWADASAPTYTTPAVYVFWTVDAGTTWLGARVGKAFG